MGAYLIKRMTPSHVESMLKIEQTSDENYWNAETFQKHIKTRLCGGLVCFDSMSMIGFVAYERQPEEQYVQIWNMVVDARFRRCGYGSQMIHHLRSHAPCVNSHESSCEISGIRFNIRESNLACQQFLKNMGFWCDAIALDYFLDETMDTLRQEDAFCFDYNHLKRRNKNDSLRIVDRLGDNVAKSRYCRRKSVDVSVGDGDC